MPGADIRIGGPIWIELHCGMTDSLADALRLVDVCQFLRRRTGREGRGFHRRHELLALGIAVAGLIREALDRQVRLVRQRVPDRRLCLIAPPQSRQRLEAMRIQPSRLRPSAGTRNWMRSASLHISLLCSSIMPMPKRDYEVYLAEVGRAAPTQVRLAKRRRFTCPTRRTHQTAVMRRVC